MRKVSAYALSDTEPVMVLTVVTYISLALFIAIPLIIYLLQKRQVIKRSLAMSVIVVNCIIGIPISLFSIFVMAMCSG